MEAMIERLVACFERGELSRRQVIAGIATLAAAAGQPSAGDAAQHPATFRAVGLNHIRCGSPTSRAPAISISVTSAWR